jgi:uncharacterized protein YkwD
MRKIFALFIILTITLSFFTSCKAAPAPMDPSLPELPKELPPFEPHAFELRVFELINRERAFHRLPPLIWHEAAAIVAREHSVDMHNNNFMGHTSSDGLNIRQRLERGCIKNVKNCSASIAGGYPTPETVVAAWIESPRYKPNILSREFTHIGVGFFERPIGSNSHFGTYWTKKFLSLD